MGSEMCIRDRINTDIVKVAENMGLLVIPAGNNVIRIIPPLIITKIEIDEGLALFDQACSSFNC